MMRSRVLAAAITLIVSAVVLCPVTASAQGSKGGERHCNTRVLGASPEGEYILSPQECYATFDQAARAAGLSSPSRIDSQNVDSVMQAPANALVAYIAVHFDGQNFGGSSISIQGSGCSGGGINWATAQSGQWNNRFESSRQYCQYGAYIRYHDTSTYGGTTYTAAGWQDKSTLLGLNNLTSSTIYGV